ncbi:hypothetical protein C7B62_24805 [Pleurocapsa sp. CCALA 161]|uniref:hypothetical protein n=1 Tax=Pleurocapsa sp. CCALA 161 TaxID=2107688 RepID=UPI000D065DDA|nr:hypothetical protein [Pleurocapsa sp. CCALA 161]PSB05626.1 hypothetical protein C7B62_24805 [Pleurocapsa sp. CCALA 161]
MTNSSLENKARITLIIIYIIFILLIFAVSIYSYINQNLLFEFLKPAYFKFKDEVAGVISSYTMFAGFLILQMTKLILRASNYKLNFGTIILFIRGLITFFTSGIFFSLNYPWQTNYLYGFELLLLILSMVAREVLEIVANITKLEFLKDTGKFVINIFTALILCVSIMMLSSY